MNALPTTGALAVGLSHFLTVSAILFTIEAWDVKCSQHITARLSEQDVEQMASTIQERFAALEAENARLRTALERLVALAKRTMKDGRLASKDPVLRQKIANLQVAERCLQLNGYRSLTRILQGAHPGPEGSTSKLFWSQVD